MSVKSRKRCGHIKIRKRDPSYQHLLIKIHRLEKKITRLERTLAKVANFAIVGPVSGVGNVIVQTPTNLGNATSQNGNRNSTTNTE
jgi:hypothetical protein